MPLSLPPSPSQLLPFAVAPIAATTTITPFDARIHRRGFTSSAPRLKERPPEDRDPVDGQEAKRKQQQQGEGKAKEPEKEPEKDKPDEVPEGGVGIDGGKRSPGVGVPSPGEVLKGRTAAAGGGSGGSGGGAAAGGESGGASSGTRPPTPTNRALQKPMVPDIYPQVMALPIAKRPLFPGFYKAVTIKDPNVAGAIQEMMKRGQPYIGAFLFKDEDADGDTIEKLDDVHDVGVFAQITSAFPVHGEEGSLTAVLYPHRRIRITSLQACASANPPEPPAPSPAPEPEIEQITEEYLERQDKGDVVASFEEPTEWRRPTHGSGEYATSFLRKYDVSIVDVENLVEEPHDKKDPVIRAVTSEIVNVFKEVATLNPLFRDQISTFSISQSAGNVIEEPAKLADFAAAVSSGEVGELQDVLESLSVADRLQKALMVIKKELMNAQLQSKISKDVEAKIQKRQREYWLLEQLKGIKRELGIESDGKDKLVDNFREKAAKLTMPEAVKKVFNEVGFPPHAYARRLSLISVFQELNKLGHLEPAASEFNVTRNYLDWLTQIPWGQRSTENYSVTHAMTVLDADHYGLQDIKDRILEFIAVGKLRGTVEGKIICFVGPPGICSTSQRPLVFFSGGFFSSY